MKTAKEVFRFVSEFNKTFKENLDTYSSGDAIFSYTINNRDNGGADSIAIEAGFKKEVDAYTYLKYLNTLPEDQWRLGSLQGLTRNTGRLYGVTWYMR